MDATLHDVARVAGVSIKTVSNVINHHPHVRQTTKDRVLAAIEEVDYRPNLSARGLRSGRSGFISLVIPAVKENYFAELAETVIREAEGHGLRVIVEQTGGDRQVELMALSGAGRPRFVDGILLSPMGLRERDMASLDPNLPMVMLGERIFGGPTDHVLIENIAASRAAVEHLLSLGRRRIAVIGAERVVGDELGSSSLRLQGYQQALEAAGLPVDPALVRPAQHWNRAGGAAVVQELIDEGASFDAIFALNDTLGLGALRGLATAGLRVPDDVAVIGFDNIDETIYSVPSMSTVDAGRISIAKTAVELLAERIVRGGSDLRPRTITSKFRVVARESTGFPQSESAADSDW